MRVNLLDALGPMRGSILHAWPCLRHDPVAGERIAAGLAKMPKLKLMFLVFFLVRSTYCDQRDQVKIQNMRGRTKFLYFRYVVF
jgi:hypothetical protein